MVILHHQLRFPRKIAFFLDHFWGKWPFFSFFSSSECGFQDTQNNRPPGRLKKKPDHLLTLIILPLSPTLHPPRMKYDKKCWKVNTHPPTHCGEIMTFSWKKEVRKDISAIKFERCLCPFFWKLSFFNPHQAAVSESFKNNKSKISSITDPILSKHLMWNVWDKTTTSSLSSKSTTIEQKWQQQ